MTAGPSSASGASGEPSQPGEHARALTEILAGRIRAGGPISFAEFMRECLYHLRSRLLLARQRAPVRRLLHERRRASDFRASPGAAIRGNVGTARLASPVRRGGVSSRRWPPGRPHSGFQRAGAARILCGAGICRRRALRARAAPNMRRASRSMWPQDASPAPPKFPRAISAGCIFSNELLDALPVHRVVVESGALREIYVGFEGGQFIEVLSEPSMPALERYFQEQGITLEEGQQAEVCFEACDWIESAGRALERGFVLTIDYGHEARALYDEHHNRGTLLAYRDHAVTENLLDAPGEQDLTAHVNFTALDLCGRRAGLTAHRSRHAIAISGRARPGK